MAVQRATKIWKLALIEPREEVFTKAQVLVQHAKDFFEWCDNNPRYKTEIIKHKMQWDQVEIELRRPYTMSGLCMYLGISGSYFRQLKADYAEKAETKDLTRDEWEVLAALEWVEQIVFTDQIEGAMTGQYNANIVARLNGLADNVNNSNTVDPVLRIVARDAETVANINLLTAGL